MIKKILTVSLFSISLGYAAKDNAKAAPATNKTSKVTAKAATKEVAPAVTPAKTPAPEETKSAAVAAPEAAPVSTAPEAKPIDFSAKDVWNKDLFDRDDNKVLVIQDRKYNKKNRIELGFDLGMTSASALLNTYSVGIRSAYYWSEYWGVQAFSNYSMSTGSRDKEQIDDFTDGFKFPSKKEVREPKSFSGIGVVWSPIYGKFSWFRSRIVHFDIYGGLGLSLLTSESNLDSSKGGEKGSHVGSLANLGMRIFLNKNWAWTTEVRNNIYQAKYAAVKNTGGSEVVGSKSVWQNNFQFVTGLSYLFNVGGGF